MLRVCDQVTYGKGRRACLAWERLSKRFEDVRRFVEGFEVDVEGSKGLPRFEAAERVWEEFVKD